MHAAQFRVLTAQYSLTIAQQVKISTRLKHANVQQPVVELRLRKQSKLASVIPAIPNKYRHAGHTARVDLDWRVRFAEHLQSCPHVRERPDLLLQFPTCRPHRARVETNAGQLAKKSSPTGKLGAREINRACVSGFDHAPRPGKVVRDIEFFREHIRGAERQDAERDISQAIDDFVDRAVAAGGHDNIVITGGRRQLRGGAGALRRCEGDPVGPLRFQELVEVLGFLAARSRIENDKESRHTWTNAVIVCEQMKVVKILLVVFLVLGLIMAGGVWYLTRLVQSPEFKEQVLKVTRDATGTDVKVGTMKVSIFSGIDLDDVTIGNPAGFTGNLLTAKSFALHYRLMPLLQKRIEVETLTLDTPVITLATNAEGDWNYDKIGGEAKPSTGKPASAAPHEKSSGGSGLDIAISRIEMKHASVVLMKSPGKELLRITDANFSSAVNLSGDKLTGNGKVSIAEAVAANSLFIRSVATPVALTGGEVKLTPLSGKIADGDLTGDAGFIGSKYSVKLNVRNADMVKLIQEAGVVKRVFSSGKLQLTTALTGTGGLETIVGDGKAEITGGQRVDVPLLTLMSTILQVPSLRDLKFDECVLEYTISNNVMQTPVISLKSPQVQITGKGRVALDDYSLDHVLTLVLTKGALEKTPKEVRTIFTAREDGSYAINFKVWGPYDHPKTDLDKIVLKGAAEQILQRFLK